MPANRFYYNGPLLPEATLSLSESEHHHLRVMRLEVGEEIEIINGMGAIGTAQIEAVKKNSSEVRVQKVIQEAPLPSRITLLIPLMRPNKLEWIVEKGTELGANALHFYGADYSEKDDLSANQLERLHNLSLAALKQSGRLFLPSIEVVPSLKRALIEEGTYYFGDTGGSCPSLLNIKRGKHTSLVTGPERGFSAAELTTLRAAAQGVSLSTHILRAETAPIAAISVLALLPE
jgi:16S rRNA (uracil1498-N3)-methyltransferase